MPSTIYGVTELDIASLDVTIDENKDMYSLLSASD